MASGRSPASNRRGAGTCHRCGKVSYRSRSEARNAKRVIHPGEKMHAYPCGTYWHIGHDELWRDLAPDDLLWKPLPKRARDQINTMAITTIGAAAA